MTKVAIITASTRGIGLASAKILAKDGVKVYLAARNLESAKLVADEIVKEGYQAAVVYFDGSQPDTAKKMVEEVYEKEGRVDILINNFGHGDPAKDLDLVNTDYQDFKQIVETNIETVYKASQAAIKVMKDGGNIVNISSVAAVSPDLARIGYSTSKAIINYLTATIAAQYARQNVRCNAIMPGFIKTDATAGAMSEEFTKAYLANVPLNRLGEVSDIAEAVLFLATDRSSYITGETIAVGGGFGKPTPLYAMYQSMTQTT